MADSRGCVQHPPGDGHTGPRQRRNHADAAAGRRGNRDPPGPLAERSQCVNSDRQVLTSGTRGLASRRFRAGLLLLVLGIAVFFAVTVFSLGTEVPREATWIFVPQEELRAQSMPDYKLEGVTLRLDLTNSDGPMLQVEFRLTIFNLTRTYGLGILQPFRVIEKDPTASLQNQSPICCCSCGGLELSELNIGLG